MKRLLIADSDSKCREKLRSILEHAGYHVELTDSVAGMLDIAINKRAEVIILGQSCEDINAADLVPLLKHCNRKIPIILVSGDQPLSILRKVRSEGIFFHARNTFDPDARQELLEAVGCALKNFLRTQTPCNSY